MRSSSSASAAPPERRHAPNARVVQMLVGTAIFAAGAPLLIINGLSGRASSAPAVVATARAEDSPHLAAAGAAVVESVAAELKVKKKDIEGITYALTSSTAALAMEVNATRHAQEQTEHRLEEALREIEQLRLTTAALNEPWNGHNRETRCASNHRCANYIDAGKTNLTALMTVASCKAYCTSAYPATNFFAFHNEVGWIAFMLDPKGRCRCYATNPCELVPDGGYTLWSSSDTCSPDLLAADT